MIKWKFKNTEVYFVSEDKNLLRDVYKNAKRVGVEPTQKIEIYNDLFTNLEFDPADLASFNGDSSSEIFTTLQVDAQQTEFRNDETTGLRGMSDVLDELRSPLNSVGNRSSNGSVSKFNGSVSGKRGRKGV